MKTLTIVRHAKSSWDEPALPDHDRPLAPRGERELRLMALRHARLFPPVDLLLSSSAVRARETAGGMAEAMKLAPAQLRLREDLYDCGVDHLAFTVKSLDDELHSVMLVGHNPELSGLLQRFDAACEPLPTCAIVRLSLDVAGWEDAMARPLRHLYLDTPRMHRRRKQAEAG